MENTLSESIANARAEVRSALYDLERIVDQVQESHNIFLGQSATLKRTLKSARSAILDSVDQLEQPSE